jgi:hypothetical protein
VNVTVANKTDNNTLTREDILKVYKKAETYKDKIKLNNKYTKEGQKRAVETYKKYKKKVQPKVAQEIKRIKKERGITVGNKTSDERILTYARKKQAVLQQDERIYIFMSSSVPKVVWIEYAKMLDKAGEPNIVMVLRGCIGGCKYIKPTIGFIKSIIIPDLATVSQDDILNGNVKQLNVQIWIDPLLFRTYHITRVPCFVYVKGLQIKETGLSEGWNPNIEQVTENTKSLGDWNFDYHLKQLYKESHSHSKSLLVLSKKLNKTWFEEESNAKDTKK